MRNSRPLALVLVLGLIVGLMAAIAGAAAAQTTQGRLAFVNGNSTDPVAVTINGESVATDLAFAATSDAVVRESGAISVAFTDGSSLEGSLPAASAWTVVSGFGTNDANAYPAVIEPIPDGQAKVAVWNATNDTVLFSVNGSDPFELLAGEGLEPQVVPADQEFTVQVGVDATETFSYTPSRRQLLRRLRRERWHHPRRCELGHPLDERHHRRNRAAIGARCGRSIAG